MKFQIQEWCFDNIDGAKLNSTNQIVGTCPWCGKTNRFYVDNEKGHYICFACEQAGRYMVGLIAHVEQITRSEAQRLIMRSSVEFRRKETPESLMGKIISLRGGEEKIEEKVDFPLPKEFIPVYNKGKWLFPIYLRDRKIKRQTAKDWGLGWCRKGRYGERIVIPVECPNGRSFTARDVTGEQEPKYLNPPGADHARLLLGWKHHKIKGDVVLVEGPLDAIKLWQHGIPALALMGKNIHPEQLGMLFKKPQDSAIIIMLDPEEVEAPYKVAAKLVCRFDNVSIAKLPEGVDPGASTRRQARTACDDSVQYTGNRTNRLEGIVGLAKKRLDNFY